LKHADVKEAAEALFNDQRNPFGAFSLGSETHNAVTIPDAVRRCRWISVDINASAFGLFFVSPLVLIPARLAGGALALTLVRRQRPVKLAFNLALFAVEASVALVIFHALRSGPGLGWENVPGALTAPPVVAVASPRGRTVLRRSWGQATAKVTRPPGTAPFPMSPNGTWPSPHSTWHLPSRPGPPSVDPRRGTLQGPTGDPTPGWGAILLCRPTIDSPPPSPPA